MAQITATMRPAHRLPVTSPSRHHAETRGNQEKQSGDPGAGEHAGALGRTVADFSVRPWQGDLLAAAGCVTSPDDLAQQRPDRRAGRLRVRSDVVRLVVLGVDAAHRATSRGAS